MSVQSVQNYITLNSLNGCSKTGVQIYPLKGVYILNTLLFETRPLNDAVEHLNIERFGRVPSVSFTEHTNSGHGAYTTNGNILPSLSELFTVGNICLLGSFPEPEGFR